MPRYELTAKVDQIVTKHIKLLISASSEEEAQGKARAALMEYPKPIEEVGIHRIVTQKSNYWIPRSIEFLDTKPTKDEAA